MALLHGASKIFTDFKTILFDTDTYVISNVYSALKDSPDNSFIELINCIKENNEINYEYIGQVKNSINPLMDFIEDQEEADLCYKQILFNANMDPRELIDELAPTDIGKSLLTLMKDDNVKKLYVYIETPTPNICEVVYNFFGDDDRVVVVGGDKKNFLQYKEFYCDTYIFQDINDTHSLIGCGKRDYNVDVLVPEFPFNIQEETGNIALYNDDGKEIEGEYLSDEYNINISTIELPLI